MNWLLTILIIKLVLIALCGLFWRLGGAEGFSRAWRWVGIPILFALNALLTLNLFKLISVPLQMGAYSVGYGPNSKLGKLLKNKYLIRATCGLLYTTSALFALWGNWWFFGYYVIAGTSWVCLNGNQKFKFNDITEEGGMGLFVGIAILN